MKRVLIACAVLLAGVGGNAMATCVDEKYEANITGTEALNTLSGMRIDATAPTPGPDSKWDEDHCFSPGVGIHAALYKVGVSVNDPVDPRAYRGTWIIFGSWVIYDYGTGGSYNWALYEDKNGDAPHPGGLCWEDYVTGEVIATAPPPIPIPSPPVLDCTIH